MLNFSGQIFFLNHSRQENTLSFIYVAGSCYTVKIMKMNFILLTAVLLLLLTSCRENKEAAVPSTPVPKKAVQAPPRLPGCTGCHNTLQLDEDHAFACTQCHQGNDDSKEQEASHQGLLATPADPAHMAETCGTCHSEQLATCASSSHFTLNKAVNLVRSHFGLEAVSGLTEIPDNDHPPRTKKSW
ncbi:MAG: hypothetical protein D3923_08725 [Candidatus Electrothrix sp. AR3]|nr:hypothetical protein [Candidatus Electrothrix sp. AR3]